MMRIALRRFRYREEGAVTVDYVPLVAAAVSVGVLVIGTVFSGAQTAGDNVGEATRNIEVSGGSTSGGGNGSGSTPPSGGGSGSAPGGSGSFVPGNGACQGVPGVSCSGLGDGSNPGAGSGNNNAGDTPGGSGVNNPGGGAGNDSGGGSGSSSGGGNSNPGGGNGNSAGNGNGNPGGGNSGNSNPGQGNGNAGSGGGNGGQGANTPTPPGDGAGDDDGSTIPTNPDFTVPAQTLTPGWDDTVTSDWLSFGGNGGLPGEGPVNFTVSGDGNPVLQTDNGHSSEGQIPPSGTNIIMETPRCGTTNTVVIEFDDGQTGIWQVSRPSWPTSWGAPPAGC